MLLQKYKNFYNNILFYNNVWQKNVNRLKIMLAIAHGIAILYFPKRILCSASLNRHSTSLNGDFC